MGAGNGMTRVDPRGLASLVNHMRGEPRGEGPKRHSRIVGLLGWETAILAINRLLGDGHGRPIHDPALRRVAYACGPMRYHVHSWKGLIHS